MRLSPSRKLFIAGALVFAASFGTCMVTADAMWNGHGPGATIGGIALCGMLVGFVLLLVSLIAAFVEWLQGRRQ